jgi:uncharacterized protein YhbP (UPF0306 family)
MTHEPERARRPEFAPVVAVMAETTALTLATLDDDTSPRATPLFFAVDACLRLYFLSEPQSRHVKNLDRDPRAGAALFPAKKAWKEIRGLQIQGRVSRVSEPERRIALDLYAARFPFIAQLGEAVGLSEMFCLTPSWIRLIDNRRGFAFKQEWTLT